MHTTGQNQNLPFILTSGVVVLLVGLVLYYFLGSGQKYDQLKESTEAIENESDRRRIELDAEMKIQDSINN